MMFGGLGNNWYDLPVYNGYNTAHYLKCFDASTAAPLNGLRLQHASQFNTNNLDPAVPQMNVTDWRACLRMSLLFFYLIDTIIMHIVGARSYSGVSLCLPN